MKPLFLFCPVIRATSHLIITIRAGSTQGRWEFCENFSKKNGLLRSTLPSFCAEYATFIQRLQNFYDIAQKSWFLAHLCKMAEVLVFPIYDFQGMILGLFWTESMTFTERCWQFRKFWLIYGSFFLKKGWNFWNCKKRVCYGRDYHLSACNFDDIC